MTRFRFAQKTFSQIFLNSSQTEDRNKLWHARHKLYYASLSLRPGCRSVITDVCVPISRLPEMVALTKKDFDDVGISG